MRRWTGGSRQVSDTWSAVAEGSGVVSILSSAGGVRCWLNETVNPEGASRGRPSMALMLTVRTLGEVSEK